MLAISTAWNSRRYRSGKKIVEEVKGLGFNSVELNFSLSKKIVKEISEFSEIQVVSLHNFCPLPDGLTRKEALPDSYSLSSRRKNIREKAIKFTKRTILTAKKFDACVVLHLGRVEIKDYTRKLISIKKANGEGSLKFKKLKERMKKERNDNAEIFFDSAFQSLKDLSQFAFDNGIKLGIENRFYFREIPNLKETKILLSNFGKMNTFYWHDTGHAFIREKLGFEKEIEYLKAFNNYLLGLHIHDVKNLSDHKAPFTGEINFKYLNKFINRKTIKVIEAHQPASAKEIVLAKNKLERIFN